MRLILLATVSWAGMAQADTAIIEDVKAVEVSDEWRFDVTISHPDTGWDHYADGWKVTTPEGVELGHRVLAHPHVEEQPFTRSLGGIVVPDGVNEVIIHARCSVDGWSDQTFRVALD